MFDEYMAKCVQKGKCDRGVIKGIKVDYLNLIKALDSEEMSIKPGDTADIIKFKLAKMEEFVYPFTAKDDLGGIDNASIDITHANLNKISSKLGITSSCQAGPPTRRFRFVQKSIPEEVTTPEPADLKTMVIVAQLYNETVLNKPVFAVALHNKIKKANSNSLDLPQNICEGVDTDALMNEQRNAGLIKLAISNKLKVEFTNAIADAIPKLDVQPNEVKQIVDDLVKEMMKVQSYLGSIPNVFAAL